MRAAVRYGLCVGLHWAARLTECLAVTEEGLGLVQGDLEVGVDRLGFSPSLGFSSLHGHVLNLMGRPQEGGAELDRVIELALASQQLVPLFLSNVLHVARCEVTGEATLALAHARKALEYAVVTPVAQTYGYLALGIANILNRAWDSALEALEQSLAIGRE